VDIVGMVSGITKYAQTIVDPETIVYHLGRALHLAKSGRPGPCWLDIPVDVQAAIIEPSRQKVYQPIEDALPVDPLRLEKQIAEVVEQLLQAQRPVILAGTGVRLSGATRALHALADRLAIPIVTAWTHDLIPSDHPAYCGRQGTIGTRAGNFTVQNADFLLIIGSRLCIRQISYNWQSFARHATTVQVDIDAAELNKPTFQAKSKIHADAHDFIQGLLGRLPRDYRPSVAHQTWLGWARERVARYPAVLPKHRRAAPGTINQYHLVELLFRCASDTAIFACGDATACITPFQAGLIRGGQRLFSNSGSASMGYDLPAAIGAAAADPNRTVVCLAGDGSVQMNIQELATLAQHRFNIKVFILNNGGYHSIRSTQNNFFKQLIGEGPESGVVFPDYVALAVAYGIPAEKLDAQNPEEHLARILSSSGPSVTVVELDRSQSFEPKLSSKRLPDGRLVTAPLEDMAPFLERGEFAENMIVPMQGE
jgi:acetolactate synthase I/II/III large subunit